MEDKQSREEINETFKDQQRKLWDQFGVPGDDMEIGIDYAKPGKDLTVRLTADVSDAIKGLKFLQREAKKTTAALKELDDIKRRTCPSCGLISLDVNKLCVDEEVIAINKKCLDCGWSA